MKKIIQIIAFISVFVSFGDAQLNAQISDPNALFLEGNSKFDSTNFEGALTAYKTLVDNDFQSKELYYNLGNTYFRLKSYTQSILNYERALKLDPNWKDAQANVALARTKIADKQERSREGFVYWLSSAIPFTTNFWAWAGIFLLIASFLSYVFFKRSSANIIVKATRVKFIAFLVLFLCAVFVSGVKYARATNSVAAIIIAPSTTIKSQADFSSESAFVLHEGAKVIILNQKEDWYNIRFGSNEGWINEEQLALI